MKRVIYTDKAPKPIGPYSQAIEVNGVLYISGQVPVNAITGEMPATIEEQTKQVMENIKAILEEAGYTFDDVVKSTVLLTDMGNFKAMNSIYAEYYTNNKPARAAFAVKGLPLGALVEIETIAVKNN